jgi:hypothetical protein
MESGVGSERNRVTAFGSCLPALAERWLALPWTSISRRVALDFKPQPSRIWLWPVLVCVNERIPAPTPRPLTFVQKCALFIGHPSRPTRFCLTSRVLVLAHFTLLAGDKAVPQRNPSRPAKTNCTREFSLFIYILSLGIPTCTLIHPLHNPLAIHIW